MSKQDALCPMRTVMTRLFVINFALFTDCETNLRKCAMTSLKGRAVTTMLSLRRLRSPLIFTMLSLLILEA